MSTLIDLKDKIESMSKCHQIEILRILKKQNKVSINENNNGTFINLTELTGEIILKLCNYVKYVEEQQSDLLIVEQEKNRLENTFFKGNKELENTKL